MLFIFTFSRVKWSSWQKLIWYLTQQLDTQMTSLFHAEQAFGLLWEYVQQLQLFR